MDKFWSLFEESIITQSVVTMAVIVTDCVLVGLGRTVPNEMWTLTMLVCGFWFGSKAGFAQATNKAVSATTQTVTTGAHDG
jgi:uncharacterized membrane protein